MRALASVALHLATTYPDGVVRVGRRAFAGLGTWAPEDDGVWRRQPVAATFPLAEAVSVVGEPSEMLTAEWTATRAKLVALIDDGLVT